MQRDSQPEPDDGDAVFRAGINRFRESTCRVSHSGRLCICQVESIEVTEKRGEGKILTDKCPERPTAVINVLVLIYIYIIALYLFQFCIILEIRQDYLIYMYMYWVLY